VLEADFVPLADTTLVSAFAFCRADGYLVSDLGTTALRTYTVSTIASLTDTAAPSVREYTWEGLVELLTSGKPVESDKRDLPLFFTGRLSLRDKAHTESVSCITVDYDAGANSQTGELLSLADALDKLTALGVLALGYTSPNHADAAPRWRVVCPLSRDYGVSDIATLAGLVDRALGGCLARDSFTWRVYFYGARLGGTYRTGTTSGTKYIDQVGLQPLLPVRATAEGPATPARIYDGEGRREAMLSAAAKLRDAGLSGAALRDALYAWDETHCDPPRWTTHERDCERIASDYSAKAERVHASDYLTDVPLPARGPAPVSAEAPALPGFRAVEARIVDVEHVVDGFIPKGGVVLLYGESGAGKSFLAIDLAMRIAAGLAVDGREVKAGPVLYLATEGEGGIANRVVGWQTANELRDVPAHFIACSLDLVNGESLAGVLGWAEAFRAQEGRPPACVVIDTVAKAFGGDENSGQEVKKLIDALTTIARSTQATVLAVYHTGKNADRGARGSYRFKSDVDTSIVVTKENDYCEAVVDKQKDSADGVRLAFRLRPQAIGLSASEKLISTLVVDYIPSAEVAKRPKAEEILEAMGAGPHTRDALREAANDADAKHADRLFRQMLRRCERDPETNLYTIRAYAE
jgi:hypothetical protein